MSKKTIAGIVILVLAIVLLVFTALETSVSPQQMYQDWGADADRRLQQIQTFRSIANILGYGLGAVGLVLLVVGLLEKKDAKRKVIILILAVVFVSSVFTTSNGQTKKKRERRPAPARTLSAQEEARQQVNKFWEQYVAYCNGSYYIKRGGGKRITELRGFYIKTTYYPLTSADRLNGVEIRGGSFYGATAHRNFIDSRWSEWGTGIFQADIFTNEMKFEKKNGQWNVQGGNHFYGYAETITCSDLPWTSNKQADSKSERAPISGGVLNGKAISLPNPNYPKEAKDAGVSGTVTVQVTIDENGNVISARAVSGRKQLQEAAVAAAFKAKFQSTKLSGQPVKVTGVLTYKFE